MASEIVVDIVTWKEYAQGLDLSHWRWEMTTPWEDGREVVELGDYLYAIPVYSLDICNDPDFSIIRLNDRRLLASWDNYHKDIVIIEAEDEDELVGWMVVEQLDGGRFVAKGGVYEDLEKLKEDWI